ncbi:MAG: hypothetical protein ABI439_11560 [Rhodospirillales bacterium]
MRVLIGISFLSLAISAPAPAPATALVKGTAEQPVLEPTLLPAVFTHSAEQWNNSIDDLIVHLKGVHPDPFAKIGRLEFLRSAETLKKDILRLTEEQRMVRLMQLTASIGDGHTQVEPDRPDFGFWYPINLAEFPDGYFITSAYKTNPELAGAQILKVSGRPVAEAVAMVRSLRGADNAFGNRLDVRMLDNAALMRGLGLANAAYGLAITVRLANGQVATRTLAPIAANSPVFKRNSSTFSWSGRAETYGPPLGEPKDWMTAFNGETAQAFRVHDERHPAHLTQRLALTSRNFPDAHTYYVQSNIVEDSLDESFRHFFSRAMREIDAARPTNVILDLRNNEGGDGSRVPELIPLFSKHLSADQNLYVLTGPKTFSAAILWLGDFINFLHPTIVGEPAGAALNSFGDAHEYPLPEIGATSHISTLRNVKSNVNDLARLTPVDVPAPMTFADWRSGRDPAVDPILAGQEMRSFAQVALTDGARAARQSLASRIDRFTKYPWWTPPTEIELRRSVQLLTEKGRYEDAIAIGEISTTFHPDIWNSWYNLGKAQLDAGRLIEGQASLRKVLKVDPDNFNKDELAAISSRSPEKEFTVPAILHWGESSAAIEASAKRQCSAATTRRINPPFLDSVKRLQQQVDCDGFQYQGAPRHLELVVRDGELVMAWLMMRADEQSRVLEWLKRDFNEEQAVESGNYVVYPKHMVAWRKDKSELLFYSPQISGEVAGWFAQQ